MKVYTKEDAPLFLSIHVGNFEITNEDKSKEKVEIGVAMHDMSPIFQFEDGGAVMIDWNDLIKIAEKAREEHNNEQ